MNSEFVKEIETLSKNVDKLFLHLKEANRDLSPSEIKEQVLSIMEENVNSREILQIISELADESEKDLELGLLKEKGK